MLDTGDTLRSGSATKKGSGSTRRMQPLPSLLRGKRSLQFRPQPSGRAQGWINKNLARWVRRRQPLRRFHSLSRRRVGTIIGHDDLEPEQSAFLLVLFPLYL